jgi:hypothetical protein
MYSPIVAITPSIFIFLDESALGISLAGWSLITSWAKTVTTEKRTKKKESTFLFIKVVMDGN